MSNNPIYRLFLLLRSILFTLVLIAYTIPYGTLCLFCYKLPYKIRYRIITSWTALIIFLLRYICGIRYVVHGAEHISDQNAVILSNHQSTWETFVLPNIFPHPSIITKKQLLHIPFFGWGFRLLDPIAIDRKDKSAAMAFVLNEGKRRLQAGRWILIFPEGTRMAPDEKADYQIGGVLLAKKAGFPVIPVAHNAGRFWPKKRFIKHPGTIQVFIGPPIETKGRKAADVMQQAKAWIEEKRDLM
jgi:1-acyl-sn-glycerol-3-phosphate acyltransferase